jgi:hypothetical protein
MGGPLPPRDVIVAKGPVPYCLEEISKASDARVRLDTLRTDIAALAPSYSGLAAVFHADLLSLVYPNPADADNIKAHLERHWFDATAPYFPGEPVPEIYARGVLQALELSLNGTPSFRPPLEIDAWWQLDHPNVEMLTLLTPSNRLSLHILTPRPPGSGVGPSPMILGQYSTAWVTAAANRVVDTKKFDGDPTAPKRG